MSKQQYVVVIGNPFDGLTIHGSFSDLELASEWAERKAGGDDWHVVYLYEAKNIE